MTSGSCGKPQHGCTPIDEIINVKNLIKYGKSFKEQSGNSLKDDKDVMEEVDSAREVW